MIARQTLPTNLQNRRFHVVLGKGGVGRSTVSRILALHFAEQGYRTLLCEVDESEQLSIFFGVRPSKGEQIVLDPSLPSLKGVNLRLEEALKEYGTLKLKFKSLGSRFADHALTRALVALVPGSSDLIAFGKAFHHERERVSRLQGGGLRWDRVIVDAPATGHGLTFLQLPRVIMEMVPTGNLFEESRGMWNLISDTSRSALHLVTTAEPLPISETEEYAFAIQKQGLEIAALWVNKMNTLALDKQFLKMFTQWSESLSGQESMHTLSKLVEWSQDEISSKQILLSQLNHLTAPRIYVPQLIELTPDRLKDVAVLLSPESK